MKRLVLLPLLGTSALSQATAPPPASQAAEDRQAVSELVTDRPDFTESTEIAPRGWIQWESGFAFGRVGGDRSALYGAPLWRIGLARRLELRIGSDGYTVERPSGGDRRVGLADSSLGFKYKVFQEHRFTPALSIIPAVTMPTGNSVLTSHGRDPGIKFALAKDLPLGFSASSNANWASLTDDRGRYPQRSYSLSMGHGVANHFSAYGEVYKFSCDGRGDAPFVMVQGGLTYSLGNHTQMDISLARRATRAGPDQIVSFGFATRSPMGGMVRRAFPVIRR